MSEEHIEVVNWVIVGYGRKVIVSEVCKDRRMESFTTTYRHLETTP